MIRIVQRRLIIPQGDTGTLIIPIQGTVTSNDYAVLAIYDPLTHTTVRKIKIQATPETLSFNFKSSDTLNIEPSNRYVWDVIIYRNAIFNDISEDDFELVSADSVDSYYSAYRLPTCDIRVVAANVQK